MFGAEVEDKAQSLFSGSSLRSEGLDCGLTEMGGNQEGEDLRVSGSKWLVPSPAPFCQEAVPLLPPCLSTDPPVSL